MQWEDGCDRTLTKDFLDFKKIAVTVEICSKRSFNNILHDQSMAKRNLF